MKKYKYRVRIGLQVWIYLYVTVLWVINSALNSGALREALGGMISNYLTKFYYII